ncbi:YjbE family integral membrane protein [Scopulibacillus darangshiensis]|uniref:YjbE family integral membrane protein n=1 Tax=Scopulibacillus darangshiensis TaxID=442528 RepID=A0A4R2NHL2_9BACL|nr:TerC family protein [Scopulibacillus darangshiensis]TCP20959.1 YjbE family integral membrane protein [Scopulibacillus darangshiensis]
MDGTFLFGLLEIILINIVLSGDNAVVIALACRNLPKSQQNKAIFWGSFGAIVLRVVLTFVAVWLLQIPFVKIVGGLLLVYIAINLLIEDDETDLKGSSNILGAIRTIIIADLIMSLDNVVAVAGAAGGSILLIIIGLAVSIPLIIWGSQLLMKLMDRFPIIIILGAALLGYTAGEMLLADEAIDSWFHGLDIPYEKVLPIILAVIVVAVGLFVKKKKKEKKARTESDRSE